MKVRRDLPVDLTAEDMALAVYGPWHPRAGIAGDTPLRDPRCATVRLQSLWTAHRAAIERAAAAAAIRQPWIASRLALIAVLRGTDDDAA